MKKTQLLKQRTTAKMLCDKQYVKINGQYAKPSRHVGIGDIIEIETTKGTSQYKILMIPNGNLKKSERGLYYEEVSGNAN